jgi:hypothetical protein
MPVNPFIRWKDFSFILENTEENFTYEIYRPSSRVDSETGYVFEVLSNVEFGFDCMWIYPQEDLKHNVSGSIYTVELIFLFKPNVNVQPLDLILRRDRETKLYRVLGINDFKSHLEVNCYSPQIEGQVFEKAISTAFLSTTAPII